MPKISIITPYYSGEKFVHQLLDSTRRQTFADFEHVIVDDCSPLPSAVILNLASIDSRYKYIRLPTNVGPAAARNIGISHATGRYLCFLDADDIWYPAKLATQYRHMTEAGIAFSFHQYLMRKVSNQEDIILGPIMSKPSYTYRQLLGSRGIGCSTVMIDRKMMSGDFRFPEVDRKYPEDLLAWLRLTKQGIPAIRLKQVLSEYRVHDGNRSRDKLWAASAVWRAYTRHLGIHPVAAALYFLSYLSWSIFETLLWRPKR